MGPPFHLVGFVQVHADFLARGGGGRRFEGPGAFRGADLGGEGALFFGNLLVRNFPWGIGDGIGWD